MAKAPEKVTVRVVAIVSGWFCPECDIIVSPYVDRCPRCSDGKLDGLGEPLRAAELYEDKLEQAMRESAIEFNERLSRAMTQAGG